MMHRSAILTLLAGAAVVWTGCSMPSYRASVVPASQARKIQTVKLGVVQSVSACVIEGDTGQNYSIGQRAGASAGQSIAYGMPVGTAVGGAVGAVVGGVIGENIEKGIKRQDGQTLEIVLDDGTYIAVTQEAEPPFIGGERVKVMIVGDSAHVVHAEPEST